MSGFKVLLLSTEVFESHEFSMAGVQVEVKQTVTFSITDIFKVDRK